MKGVAVLVGPALVQCSCELTEQETDWAAQALANIDDNFALVAERPIAVAVLWRELFESLPQNSSVQLAYPSWWPDRRVETVADAARAAVDTVTVVPRAQLLASTQPVRPSVVVEIAELFVVLSAPTDSRPTRVVTREDNRAVVDETARQLASMSSGSVVVDHPDGVEGAAELAASLAERLRADGRTVIVVDDGQLLLANEPEVDGANEFRAAKRQTAVMRTPPWKARVGVALAAAGVAVVAIVMVSGPGSSVPQTTLLVEGRVVVEVPATWTARRIAEGPGSPRLQVNSPTDPQVAVHLTQSSVASGETLQMTAETLRRAMDREPPGVFADFDAGARHGATPVVTYREIRPGHDIRWTVLLDGGVRISVGCQSARGAEGAVDAVCEQAIGSVREFVGTVAAQP